MGTTRVVSGPGGGKTTRLINELEKAFHTNGSRICYLTYSKAMAKEARERSGLPSRMSDGQVAGTLHSVYSQLLGYGKDDFLDMRSIREFFEGYAIPITTGDVWVEDALVMTTGGLGALSTGGKILSEFDAHQQAYRPLMPVDGYAGCIDKLYEGYLEMKADRKDYTDILLDATQYGISPDAELLLVDEGQDLTRLMYDVVLEAEKDADEVLIAGDPNQTIFGFKGCDPSFLLDHPGKEEVLPWSYRCRREILESGESVLSGVPEGHRIDGEVGGEVFDDCDIEWAIDHERGQNGACYILARTNWLARRVGRILQSKGIAYGAINPRHWRAISPWTYKVIRVNNALACYSNESEPTSDEKKELILSTPAKLLHRGVKTLVKNGDYDLSSHSLKSLFSKEIPARELLPLLDIPDRAQIAIEERGIRRVDSSFKFHLDTKHSSKGMQCDSVISIQEVPRVIKDAVDVDVRVEEEECRLEYVARTRARERLYLVT